MKPMFRLKTHGVRENVRLARNIFIPHTSIKVSRFRSFVQQGGDSLFGDEERTMRPMPVEEEMRVPTLSVTAVVERYLAACVALYGITYEKAEALLEWAVQLRGPLERNSDSVVFSECDSWIFIDFAMEHAEHPLQPALFLVQTLKRSRDGTV